LRALTDHVQAHALRALDGPERNGSLPAAHGARDIAVEPDSPAAMARGRSARWSGASTPGKTPHSPPVESAASRITSMLLSVGFFAGMDALLKTLSHSYPSLEVSALRGAASCRSWSRVVLLRGNLRDLKPVRWPLHLVRGVLAIIMLTSFIYALRVLPMADAYAVFLAAPLIVTGLSVPLLGERVDWRRWVAIRNWPAGTLALLRPTAASLGHRGALAGL